MISARMSKSTPDRSNAFTHKIMTRINKVLIEIISPGNQFRPPVLGSIHRCAAGKISSSCFEKFDHS